MPQLQKGPERSMHNLTLLGLDDCHGRRWIGLVGRSNCRGRASPAGVGRAGSLCVGLLLCECSKVQRIDAVAVHHIVEYVTAMLAD